MTYGILASRNCPLTDIVNSSMNPQKVFMKKGYHITEVCVITVNSHSVSIFSRIHSSKEKRFTSINDMTFSAMERGASLLGTTTFVMDQGYDDNKMFLKLDSLKQDYAIRFTSKRKLFSREVGSRNTATDSAKER